MLLNEIVIKSKSMKFILKLWMLITLVCLALITVRTVDLYVSMKYEVDEAVKGVVKISSELTDKKRLLSQQIFLSWSILIYLSLNFLVILVCLGWDRNFNKKSKS